MDEVKEIMGLTEERLVTTTAVNKIKIIKIIDKLLEWSIYLMLFSLPFSKSIIEICISVGIVLLLLKKSITKNFKLPSTPANLPLLLIFIAALLSLVNSQYLSLSLRAIVTKNIKFIMLYFLVIEAIDTRVKMLNVLWIGLLSGVIIFSDTLIQYFVTHIDLLHNYPPFKYINNVEIIIHTHYTSRFVDYFIGYPTGSFPYPNDLAAWLLLIIPVAMCIALFAPLRVSSRLGLLIFLFVGLYIFILAKARTAWLGFVLSITLLVFLKKKKVIVFGVLTAMFILAMFCFFNSPDVIFGLSSMGDRLGMWQTGWAIFKNHPVIGNGINTFFNNFREYRTDVDKHERGSYAHNCYLQMAADTGLIGLGGFLWLIYAYFCSAIKNLRKIVDPLCSNALLGISMGLFAFLIHSFFDTNLYSLNLASLFWLALGLGQGIIKISEKT